MQDVVRYIATHLTGDLSLTALAQRFDIGSYKLHRAFANEVGVTLAKFVQSTRLQAACVGLVLHDSPITQIAYECGYRNHETFTRAFNREFGVSPQVFRSRGYWQATHPPMPGPVVFGEGADAYRISVTRAQYLRPLQTLRQRHVGPYEAVSPDVWRLLADWLIDNGVAHGLSFGIGHDAATAPRATLRFDAAYVVEERLDPPTPFVCEASPSGWFAGCTFAGPIANLTGAMPHIYAQAQALSGYVLTGLPVIEVYHEDLAKGLEGVSHVDVYLALATTVDGVE